MTQVFRLTLAACLLVAHAASTQAATTAGSNFDGHMSLIYDQNNGNVFIENAPLSSPAVHRLVIQSTASAPLIHGNLNIPSLIPGVTVNSNASNVIDIEWSSGNFLGTGSFLGNILAPSLSVTTLHNELTIEWEQFANPLVGLQNGDLIYAAVGNWQGNPVMPVTGQPGQPQPGQPGGFFGFFDVTSGQFFDPPMAYGYEYEMLTESFFTKVGLPHGLGSSFTIETDDDTVTVLEDGLHVFPSPVSKFKLTGLNPAVDATDPEAFPLYLEFFTPDSDTPGVASFKMTPLLVPEPATVVFVGMALCGLAVVRRERNER